MNKPTIHPDIKPATGDNLDAHERAVERGRKGGLATLAKYGPEHFRHNGIKGFDVYCQRHHGGNRKSASIALAMAKGWRRRSILDGQPTADPRVRTTITKGGTA